MYKVGDWVINGLEIGQIQEMDGDNVRRFSDGSFETSSTSLTVRPLTLHGKRYVEHFKYCEKEIRELPGSRSLNWPDIHRHFCNLCYNAIDAHAPKERNRFVDKGSEFVQQVRDSLREVGDVDGVQLFRR